MSTTVGDAHLRAAADAYLEYCFATATPPRIGELALRLDTTPAALARAFAKETGISLSSYLKTARVRRAQDLLRSTSLEMSAIAAASGFGTPMTFFRAFKRATGMTPRQYRTRASVHTATSP